MGDSDIESLSEFGSIERGEEKREEKLREKTVSPQLPQQCSSSYATSQDYTKKDTVARSRPPATVTTYPINIIEALCYEIL